MKNITTISEGFEISFMENHAVQQGKAVLMLHPKDYEKIKHRYNRKGRNGHQDSLQSENTKTE